MEKIKLFTHSDLDGIGCAILAKIAFGNDVDITFCNYDNIDKSVREFLETNPSTRCYITDISINKELANQINSNEDSNVTLLDHHPTALHLNCFNWCFVHVFEDEERDLKICGTKLFYEYLLYFDTIERTDALDRFCEIVRNWDTWRWDTMGEEGLISKKINSLVWLYGRNKFMEWAIDQIESETFPYLDSTSITLLDYNQKSIDNYILEKDSQMTLHHVAGKICGVVFIERYSSEVGNTLCKLHPDIDFVAMINMGRNKIEYRTIKDDINLGKDVAALFGGGGHPKAAGSQFSSDINDEIIFKLFEKPVE